MDLELRLENLGQILADIKQIDPARGRNIMTNYDDFIYNLNRMIKVQSVTKHLEKGAFHYRNSDKFFEKNSLFNALCEIKENNISDVDLKTVNLQDYITGNILTLAGLEQRLTALGWKG